MPLGRKGPGCAPLPATDQEPRSLGTPPLSGFWEFRDPDFASFCLTSLSPSQLVSFSVSVSSVPLHCHLQHLLGLLLRQAGGKGCSSRSTLKVAHPWQWGKQSLKPVRVGRCKRFPHAWLARSQVQLKSLPRSCSNGRRQEVLRTAECGGETVTKGDGVGHRGS